MLAATEGVHPRLEFDSVHEYVMYVPLPPLATVEKVTGWPTPTVEGVGVGTVTLGQLDNAVSLVNPLAATVAMPRSLDPDVLFSQKWYVPGPSVTLTHDPL
jgi:hypothetical protein